MIYEDRIKHFLKKITEETNKIEKLQKRVNEYFRLERSLTDLEIMHTNLLDEFQRRRKVKIDGYKEEIRQLKSLQRDAA